MNILERAFTACLCFQVDDTSYVNDLYLIHYGVFESLWSRRDVLKISFQYIEGSRRIVGESHTCPLQ
jgi:hypothetical protein